MKMLKRSMSVFGVIVMLLGLGAGGWANGENDHKNLKKKHPFFPSLLSTKGGREIQSSDFTDPEDCGGCHDAIYEQWNGSMHSNAWVDPVFRSLWKMGSKETDGLIDNLCAGCHSPIGMTSGELTFNKEKDEFEVGELAAKGVQCDFCHTIAGTTFLETPTHEPQNGSLIMDPGDVKRGPFKDSESPGHETAYSELHTKAEFCGSCHHVFHPVSNFPIERTYDEWKHSVYADNDIVCQDCHMMPVEKAIEVAKTMEKPKNPGRATEDAPLRDTIYTHEFVGGNFTVTKLLGADKHAEIAQERLKSAAELELTAPESVEAGELVTVKVRVINVGAGHNLPTSLTEVRQMWLDVAVTDAKGNEVYRTGALDKDHNIQPDSVIFHASAVDKDGHHTYKPWEIVRFEYNKTIPPKGSSTEKFMFQAPRTVKGPLKVAVKLRYRSYPQSVANLLLGKDAPVLPIVDMKSANTTVVVK